MKFKLSTVNPYISSLWQSRNFDKKLNKTIMKIVQNNPKLKQKYDLISNIKGVGFRAVRRFAGPALYVNWKSYISKIGSKRIRKVRYMSSLSVRRYNPDFAHFVMLQRSSVTIMRKLLCIFFGILKQIATFWQKTCVFLAPKDGRYITCLLSLQFQRHYAKVNQEFARLSWFLWHHKF